MKKTYFVTGTDTDVGKTLTASALLVAANNKGYSTAAIKPVAAGCEQTAEGLHNADALMLQQHATINMPYQQVNPVALERALAPHIAAQQAGKRLNASRLAGFCRGVMAKGADLTLIEGAGGWRVPLNERETFAQLAVELNAPVILVVAMRLGCINHALLTAEAIIRDGLTIAGWVANTTGSPMAEYQANIDSLQSRFGCPMLGEVPFMDNPTAQAAAQYLDIDLLLESSNTNISKDF